MSRTLIDLSGMIFGRLSVIERYGYVQRNTKQPTWLCKCVCGTETIIMGASLRNGTTTSCGCWQRESTSLRTRKHLGKGTPEYNSWRAMRERCNNTTNSHYASYGGRGISYCDRWSEFTNFLIDMGARPIGTTLERINNDDNYSPDNCIWATNSQQSRNTTRTKKLTFNGKTMCMKDWADELGICAGTIKHRLKTMSVEDALTKIRYSKRVRCRSAEGVIQDMAD